VITPATYGASLLEYAHRSRDPEGTRDQKMFKLTPLGSQDEFFNREEAQRDVELEIFDTDLGKVPDSVRETNGTECMVIDSDEEVVEPTVPLPVITTNKGVDRRKRTSNHDETTSSRPSKRHPSTSKAVSIAEREETYNQLLEALRPLSPPENIPELLERVAKRLESNLFDKVSNERTVNALGRSSTLLTAGRTRDLIGKYLNEKETLLSKVKRYVETATNDGVQMAEVQTGEIWEVIRGVLESDESPL
jgi:hypothetical protein